MLKKNVIIIAILISFMTLTYGRWEFMSWKYSDEFVDPVLTAIKSGYLIGFPNKIKVMSYSETKATIFLKDYCKRTFLVYFIKDDNTWRISGHKALNAPACNGSGGGSADQWLYWYF